MPANSPVAHVVERVLDGMPGVAVQAVRDVERREDVEVEHRLGRTGEIDLRDRHGGRRRDRNAEESSHHPKP